MCVSWMSATCILIRFMFLMMPLFACPAFIEYGSRVSMFVVRSPFSILISVYRSMSYARCFRFRPPRCVSSFVFLSSFLSARRRFCAFSWGHLLVSAPISVIGVFNISSFVFGAVLRCLDCVVRFSLLLLAAFWAGFSSPSPLVACMFAFCRLGPYKPIVEYMVSIVENR